MDRVATWIKLGFVLAFAVCLAAWYTGDTVGIGDTTSTDNTSKTAKEVSVLTKEQRAAFLQYYAPIIFKRAEKGDGAAGVGQDWVTNFNFDNDDWNLANNERVWRDELPAFVNDGAHTDWQIRPTLYAAAIEFMQNDRKSLVLLYHIYHARQEDHIHDWERLEIRLDGVGIQPGSGETPNYFVVTEHSKHSRCKYPNEDLNFHTTPNGMHVMIWQAQWAKTSEFYKAEVHWVENTWQEIEELNSDSERHDALVDINGTSAKVSFDYVFVPEFDSGAVSYWDAQAITYCNASDLVVDWETSVVKTNGVKRIRYELQDLADLFVTHWDDGTENTSWQEPLVPILLETPIVDELGAQEVPEGLQQFYSEGRTDLGEDNKRGYPRKHWFWGAYLYGKEDHFYSRAFDYGEPNKTRAEANQFADCLGNFWW